jgi:hypothetical protein
MYLNMQHFETLREKINARLLELAEQNKIPLDDARKQIKDYPWLYGALGKAPSDVFFICENPSIAGIQKANRKTIDGGTPDIEAQWWGGAAGSVFRPALCQLGLKTNPYNERGGWECYITNVIKQANVVKTQRALSVLDKRKQAAEWAEILKWELSQVDPKYVFCVGDKSFNYVNWLQRMGFLEKFPLCKCWHYSAQGKKNELINENIVTEVKRIIY